MDLAGACHFLLATKSSSRVDHHDLKQLIQAKHGAEVIDRMGIYAVWFAFDFAINHDDAAVLPEAQT
jgi:hypothetical protein